MSHEAPTDADIISDEDPTELLAEAEGGTPEEIGRSAAVLEIAPPGDGTVVDENTSLRVAEALRGKSIAAKHVHEALSEGVDDEPIGTFAREGGYVVLTHDTDFLDAETRGDVPVLYYADDTMDTYVIADRVAAVVELMPEPTDMPPIVNLNEWG